jgi:hypothetical protein
VWPAPELARERFLLSRAFTSPFVSFTLYLSFASS